MISEYLQSPWFKFSVQNFNENIVTPHTSESTMPRKVVALHLKKYTSERLPRAGERRELTVTADGYMIPFGDDENVLELFCGNGCTTL